MRCDAILVEWVVFNAGLNGFVFSARKIASTLWFKSVALPIIVTIMSAARRYCSLAFAALYCRGVDQYMPDFRGPMLVPFHKDDTRAHAGCVSQGWYQLPVISHLTLVLLHQTHFPWVDCTSRVAKGRALNGR